jgi:FtsZ-interacting cell division protein ZipA
LDNQDKWHVLSESNATTFKQVACSVQLADRGGPIAKNLLNKFQFAVEDTGLELNAHVEWQGSGDALQRAIELDQFCIEVDQMISVHVAQGETPIHGTKFKGLAEANGMALSNDGKFHYYANDAQLFTATDTNNVPFTAESLRNNVLKSVTFQIEIPKVGNCEQVFNQMITIAQKMASSLNASLVDDNQKPLGDLQIEKIRQQLKVIHATMVARGIMPGSLGSMRLFS